MDSAKIIVVLVLLLLLVALIFLGPMFTIWSLNTLFGTQIPFNFETWAAVIWLMTVFHGIRFQIKKN
jgi:hypothetical protein